MPLSGWNGKFLPFLFPSQNVRLSMMGPQASLGAERRHRLHAGRPARRQIARKQRDDCEDASH
jgi:hypothetical protein